MHHHGQRLVDSAASHEGILSVDSGEWVHALHHADVLLSEKADGTSAREKTQRRRHAEKY
jgi:hypothetical protein